MSDGTDDLEEFLQRHGYVYVEGWCATCGGFLVLGNKKAGEFEPKFIHRSTWGGWRATGTAEVHGKAT